VQPHVTRPKSVSTVWPEVRSLLDVALTMQQDAPQFRHEAFAESLAASETWEASNKSSGVPQTITGRI